MAAAVLGVTAPHNSKGYTACERVCVCVYLYSYLCENQFEF